MRPIAWQHYELYAELHATVAASLIKNGIEKERANQASLAVVDAIAHLWAGQQISYPIGFRVRAQARDEEIYRRKNAGEHTNELARAFRMSQRGIGKAYRRAQLRHAAEDSKP